MGWDSSRLVLDEQDQGRYGHAVRRILERHAPLENGGVTITDLTREALRRVDATAKPTILIIEDFQWIDDSSADVLWQIVRELADCPLIVAVTMRPNTRDALERFSRFADSSPMATYISLSPLSEKETAALLSRILELPVGDAVAARVHEATQGFPLYIDGIGRWLLQTPVGQGRSIDDALAALAAGETFVPSRIFGNAVSDRMDQLPPDVGQAIYLLATAAHPMGLAELERVLQTDSIQDSDMLSTGIVRRVRSGRKYVIQHRSLAQSILSDLSPAQRAELRMALSQVTSGIVSLRHRVSAIDLAPQEHCRDQLLADLKEHADTAYIEQRLEEAAECYRAICVLAPSEVSAVRAVRCTIFAHRSRAIIDLLPSLRQLPPGAVRNGLLAQAHFEQGAFDEAVGELRQFPCPSADDYHGKLEYARAATQLGRNAIALGRTQSFETVYTRAEEMLQRVEPGEVEDVFPVSSEQLQPSYAGSNEVVNLVAIIQMWKACEGMDPARLKDMLCKVGRLIEEIEGASGDPATLMTLHSMYGTLLQGAGDHRGALEVLSKSINHGDEVGNTPLALSARVSLAQLHFEAADWDEAFALARRSAGYALNGTENVRSIIGYGMAALVPAARGEAEGRQILGTLDRAQTATTVPPVQCVTEYVRAWSFLAVGDHEGAVTSLLKLNESAYSWTLLGEGYKVLLARSLYYSGKGNLISGLVRHIGKDDSSLGAATTDYIGSHTHGFLSAARGKNDDALSFFRQALEVLDRQPGWPKSSLFPEGGGLRLYRALLATDIAHLILTEAAGIRSEEGEHHLYSEAEELATWAAAIFKMCGASALLEQAEATAAQLRTATNAPSRSEHSAKSVTTASAEHHVFETLNRLTSRQRQIAWLVAQEKSNRDIADELFISVRTVEFHVANILSKLSLRNRRDLQKFFHGTPVMPLGEGALIHRADAYQAL